MEIPGADHALFLGDPEGLADEIEDPDDARRGVPSERPRRSLATVLFTDIVGSTRRWPSSAIAAGGNSSTNTTAPYAGSSARFRGVEMDTAGDGFFARFDGPGAPSSARKRSPPPCELGIQVHAGLHSGECEVADGKVAGIAVSIGARIASTANPSEVLVSSTVKDLVAGSGLTFDDRGIHELKGVPGEWRLYSVATRT